MSPRIPVPSLRRPGAAAFGVLLVAAAACAPVDEEPDTAAGDTDPTEDCSADTLPTLTDGALTIATDSPAYPPWFVDDDPGNGEGYESAVAYAVAAELGFDADAVEWVTVTFNNAIQPGPKDFDFDINQFSITEERREAVDFSAPYYDVRQTVIALEGSDIAEASSLADLRDAELGAQVGTTSFQAVEELIEPDTEPQVFNSNDDAKLALENGQVDGLVVDLPTAFYITAAELDDGVIVGQLPPLADADERFGLVLDKDSPLTDCVSAAVETLREDGTLERLESEWLADSAGASELS